MAAFHLVVDCLAEVMQQTCALGKRYIDAQLAGKKTRNMRDLDGVVEYILTVGRAVFLPTKQLDDLGMQIVHARLKACAFALDLDGVVDLAACLFHHILDAGRMDASVGDELFQRQARNLAAHGVERGNGDCLGRVVDDQIDARDRLERANVAALASDDSALHLIVRQRHDGDRRFRHMVCRAALDGSGDNLTCQSVGIVLVLLLDLLDLDSGFVAHVRFHALEDIGFRLFLRQAGDFLQHLHLTAL